MSSATSLSKWLSKQARVVQSEGGLSRLVLFQVQAGRQSVQLEQWQFTEDSPCDPDCHAVEALEAAQADADTLSGGLQRYVLRCYYGDALEHAAQKSFTAGRRLADDDMGGTEPPTAIGARAQAMRHTEGLHALVIRGMGGITEGLRRDLQEQRAHAVELQRAIWSQEKELMDMRRRDRKDEMEYAEHQLKLDQQRTVYGILMSAAPAILGKLTGQPVAGQQGPGELALRAFLQDLTQEERLSILEGLNDGNKVRLIQLLRAFEEGEAENQQPQRH